MANQRHGALNGSSRPGSAANRRPSRDGPGSLTNISMGSSKNGLNSLIQPHSPPGGLNGMKPPLSPIGGLSSLKQAPSPTGQKYATSSSVSIGFETPGGPKQGGVMQQGRAKQGSVSASRQRIANAIGRK